MSIMGVLLNTRTISGNGILPYNETVQLGAIINTSNGNVSITTDPHSLRVQMGTEFKNTARNVTPGVLSTLGGLAFIPSAFGQFMNSMWNIPGTMIRITESLLAFKNPYVVFPFSMMMITTALMTYYTIMIVMKMLTPITKSEIEEI